MVVVVVGEGDCSVGIGKGKKGGVTVRYLGVVNGNFNHLHI